MRYLYARDERQFPVVLRREYDRRARGANIHTQSRTLPHTSFPPVTLLYIYRRCLCMRCAYNKREGSEFSAMQHTGYWISLSCWWTHGTTNEQQIERIKKKNYRTHKQFACKNEKWWFFSAVPRNIDGNNCVPADMSINFVWLDRGVNRTSGTREML